MGKGDKRSKRGKIHIGTYGNTRPKKSKTVKAAAKKAGAAKTGGAKKTISKKK